VSSGLFVVEAEGMLVPMNETDYMAEDQLQSLLADYHDLLAGDQINASAPRRWLLVQREAGVPDEHGGADQWSLDHLFLDQDAIPTFVEVKRSTDTRIRREVVGQMLDYAANGVEFWPADTLASRFAQTCEQRRLDRAAAFAGVVGEEADEDAFWATANANLKAGRIRLLFVADRIPPRLRRIIEFLNAQMDRAEILGVEVRQYVGPTAQKVLVSRVVGQTAQAEQRKTAPTERFTEETFRSAVEQRHGPEAADVVTQVFEWGRRQHLRVDWSGSPALRLRCGGHEYTPLFMRTDGLLHFGTWYLQRRPAFASPELLGAFAERLRGLPEAVVPEDPAADTVRVPMAALRTPDDRARLLAVLDWFVAHVREFHGEAGHAEA